MLRTALGSAIAGWLDDPAIVEVMLNPDGRLWIDRLGSGLADTGETLSPSDGERIIRLVAHHIGAEVHADRPRVSAELPETGERFEGLIPPVATAPTFAIRKPAVAIFTLTDYVAAGIMSAGQAELLRRAVAERANILVAGGTSTVPARPPRAPAPLLVDAQGVPQLAEQAMDRGVSDRVAHGPESVSQLSGAGPHPYPAVHV